jgi:ATP-dependent DNA ligase
MLAVETPASFVAFDLIAVGDRDLRETPFFKRREELESALAAVEPPIHLTPITSDPAVAGDWFERFEGAGLDGVVAKPSIVHYLPDQRAMVKVKHERTGDFVVAGFRWFQTDRSVVGSLMLGIYGGDDLHHVGVIGSFPAAQRRELVDFLSPYRSDVEQHPWAGWADFMVADGGKAPGVGNRWNAKKDLSFELLRPELVVEAAFEHLQGTRLRHTARFRRWRPDKAAKSCTFEQLDVAVPALLSDVFGARG